MTEFSHAAVRGIVACSGTADERACDFLDFILNPGMRALRSYLQGTKHFLNWIEKLKEQYPQVPPLFGFLTMDYTQMYPSIPDNLALPAVREYLDSRAEQKPSTQKTLELLEIVRNNNYFEFGEKIFQQDGGTSIGKKHAPPLACLSAGKLEEDKIYVSDIFKEKILKDKSSQDEKDRFYKRFIDDMISAFIGTEDEAKQFVDWMNTLWAGLKFTFDWSNKELTFLDVKLMITEEGTLETDRFVKPTNPQLFLHFKSNHPQHCFKAIVYGQAITVKTICSKQEFVDRHVELLKQKFLERGYPVVMTEEQLRRGVSMERTDLLKPKLVYPHQATPTPLVTRKRFKPTFIITFNPHNPPLREWLKETFIILQSDRKLGLIYDKPPSVVFRQVQNLKLKLVKNKFRALPFYDCQDLEERPPGCFKYEHGARGARCQLCPRLKESEKFRSNYTELQYKMRHRLTCKSRYVCYLITCQRCHKQYCGSTTDPMHVRHAGHRREILTESSPLGKHFSRCGYDKLSLQIIDCVKDGEEEALTQIEGVWQNRLACFEQHEGNICVRHEMTVRRATNNQLPAFI